MRGRDNSGEKWDEAVFHTHSGASKIRGRARCLMEGAGAWIWSLDVEEMRLATAWAEGHLDSGLLWARGQVVDRFSEEEYELYDRSQFGKLALRRWVDLAEERPELCNPADPDYLGDISGLVVALDVASAACMARGGADSGMTDGWADNSCIDKLLSLYGDVMRLIEVCRKRSEFLEYGAAMAEGFMGTLDDFLLLPVLTAGGR